jgi:hypothetical protein
MLAENRCRIGRRIEGLAVAAQDGDLVPPNAKQLAAKHACGRVCDPSAFRILHSAMRDILAHSPPNPFGSAGGGAHENARVTGYSRFRGLMLALCFASRTRFEGRSSP